MNTPPGVYLAELINNFQRKLPGATMRKKQSSSKKQTRGQKKTKKNKYKINNWSEYNNALKQRGNLTIWFSPEAIEQWEYSGPTQRGGQLVYSELAIETMLTMKKLYHLALRQTEGFACSIAKIMNLNIDIPDYTTLSRRQRTLKVTIPVRKRNEPIYIVVDSTGLKVYGEGEWKVRQHGWSKRRTWRKLHLAVDEATGEILASELTSNGVDDSEEVTPLLNEITDPIKAFGGDGAYDKQNVYLAIAKRSLDQAKPIDIIIPPRKNAIIHQHGNSSKEPLPRDEIIRFIRKHGRKNWKEQTGYHRRSIAETTMFRYKTIIGTHLSSRTIEPQQVESLIGCSILNRMAHLGMPDSYKVKAA